MWERVERTGVFEGVDGEIMEARRDVRRIVKLGMSDEMAILLRAKIERVVRGYVGGMPDSDPVESLCEFLSRWNALERHLDDIALAFNDFEASYCKRVRIPSLKNMAYELANSLLIPAVI